MDWNWFWGKVDEMVASFARPYQMVVCSTSLALSLPMAIMYKVDGVGIGGIAVAVAGVAGGTAILRTVDIKTRANAATSTAQVVTASGSTTLTQGAGATAPLIPTPPTTTGQGQPSERMG